MIVYYRLLNKKKIWQLWDSNPRPQSGLVPKTSALDHSAKLPFIKCFLIIIYLNEI